MKEDESHKFSKQAPIPKPPSQVIKINRRSPAFRYGLALLLVIAPLLLTLLVRRTGLTLNPTWPILISLLLISWYAGRGPCLLAAFVFGLVLNLFLTPPILVLKVNMTEFNRIAVLLILAWIASSRSRAEENLRRQARQQQAVARLAEQALIERNFHALLNTAVEIVAQTLGVEYSMFWEKMAREERLLARAGVGWPAGIIGEATTEADAQSMGGHVLLTKDPIIVTDLRKETRFCSPPFFQQYKVISALLLTIPRGDFPIGVLAVYSTSRCKFSEEDVNFFQACVFILAEADERLRVEAEREELLERERQARTAAEEASRLKDEFLTTVSHELRTPLNTILGWVSLLRRGTFAPTELARTLEIIERSARSQAQIINDILDVSRIITGRLRLDFRPLELHNILQAAVDSMRPTAEAKGVSLTLKLSASEALINGDSTRLQQVVWNLLSNALRFTPQGGQIEVELLQQDTHYEIKVQDTGEGISPEFLPFVFDRFRQADSSSTRRYGGLGLGLSIVRQLVELHGGTVSAESAGIGSGATFRIVLPLLLPNETPEKQPTVQAIETEIKELRAEARVDLTGLSVLVLDDDPEARRLVTFVLEQNGAQVKTAATAAEALAMIHLRKPDVIVSDIGLPEEDGYVFIRQLRAMEIERGGSIPAAALTAFTRSEDRIKAIQAGFQTHVAKPVHPEELLLVVASLAKYPAN